MTILKLSQPFAGFGQVQNEINRLFSDYLTKNLTLSGIRKYPLINVYDEENNLFLTTELPGMTEKDIEINIEADSIRISGQQEMDAEPSEGYYHRRERTGGKFSKKIMLPYRISTDAATARLVNGVLLVTLPKAEEAKPQKITVNVA